MCILSRRPFPTLTITIVLGITSGVMQASAQGPVIDHVDGSWTTLILDESRSGAKTGVGTKREPILGRLAYLNIGVDLADERLVDSLEIIHGVTDPEYVQELFEMAAGNGIYDGIVGSYRYDSYGAFEFESDYMGVYQSTSETWPGCGSEFFEEAAREVWPQVMADALARDIDVFSYDGLVWWFPFDGTCNVSGFAYLEPISHLFDHSYRAAFMVFPAAYLLKHEIGHTLGLGHLNCFFDDGEVDTMCEGGNMGFPGWFATADGEPRHTQENDLIKTAAVNQYILGWTSPTGEIDPLRPAGDSKIRWLVSGATVPDSTFLNVTRSGLYRISAHSGPASENTHPELLVIPGQEENKYWFISFEEGDGFNPDFNDYFTIAQKMGKVIVRYQFLYPDSLSNSFREALLGIGDCVELDDEVEVCNHALYGSELADVTVKLADWRIRRSPGRRTAPGQ